MTHVAAPLWIKICGLRRQEDVLAAAAAGADAVGFVFHAASPRHLDPATARALAASVPAGVAKVAVFLHPTQAEVDAAIEAVRPDWVQTDAADLERLTLPDRQCVLPVYRTDGEQHVPDALAPRCLVESGRSGTGERADWGQVSRMARRCEVVLAGGLDGSNVADAIAAVRPFGIDVSSGVESSRGVKDATLIRNFVNAARAQQARLASPSLE
jgi:phosphoribosylanthranilate isomerase